LQKVGICGGGRSVKKERSRNRRGKNLRRVAEVKKGEEEVPEKITI